jgi:glycerol uptake facilitator-like aquaporin
MNKYLAEFIGTFFLAFVVYISASSSVFPVTTSVLAALTLGICVYTLGEFSGTHINPAVTIGLWSIKKISVTDAVYYLVAQFAGALFAMFLANNLFHKTLALFSENSMNVTLGEAFGAFIFTFGIAAVVYGKVREDVFGVVVGGSLLLGLSIASNVGSNGILNPAVAFALGSFNMSYVLGPIAGALVGFNLFKFLGEVKK